MNSQLKAENKNYAIPYHILGKINAKLMVSNPATPGYQRAKGLFKNRTVNYGILKRLKNFFDYTDPHKQSAEFELVGGQEMKNFVQNTLNSERERVKLQTNNKVMSMPPSAMDNTLNLQQSPQMGLNESTRKPSRRGAAIIILNEENKILMVKRSPTRSQWMPGKWAFVGGKIEGDEEPIEAVKRECIEEAGMVLEHFIDEFDFAIEPTKNDYIFIAKAPKNALVNLNEEHVDFGWFSIDEIKKMDIVPKLDECLDIAVNKLQQKGIYK